jgi:hypothetical protein
MALRPLLPIAAVLALAMMPRGAYAADPAVSIQPARALCTQPFEITATGLEPSKAMEADITVDGALTGRVAAVTGPDGTFWSPIPMILLPCADGGVVTVSMSVGGVPSALAATFEIGEPVVALPTATATAAVTATPIPPDAGGGGSDAAAAVAGEGAPWALLGIVVVSLGGIVGTWVTRPRWQPEEPEQVIGA